MIWNKQLDTPEGRISYWKTSERNSGECFLERLEMVKVQQTKGVDQNH